MIDFKNKDEMANNVVICGSLVVALLAAGSILFLPKPKMPLAVNLSKERGKIKATTDAINAKIASANESLATYTWTGKPEDIGPVALKQVNALLQNRHLKLIGFHSVKSSEAPNITLTPFIISVDGSFPNVVAFTKDLEKSGTKLVVNQFQVSNSDQSSDKVTASIGIIAYQLPQPAADSPTSNDKGAKDKTAPDKNAKGAKKNA